MSDHVASPASRKTACSQVLGFCEHHIESAAAESILSLAAALPDVASAPVRECAMGRLKPLYLAWHKEHRDRPDWFAIGAAAKRLEITLWTLVRAAQIQNDLGLPPLEALKDALAESTPPQAKPPAKLLREYWNNEFDRVLAVLMRNASRLPDHRPFGPDGYLRVVAEDPPSPPTLTCSTPPAATDSRRCSYVNTRTTSSAKA